MRKIEYICIMKKILIIVSLLILAFVANGQEVYMTTEELPDLIQCLPAPPVKGTPAFKYDVKRYKWGKEQRKDTARAAMAIRDARWTYDALVVELTGNYGIVVSEETTPEIWKLLSTSLKTIDQMRVAPKAYFHRIRPFEYFKESTSTGEDDVLRGEGSYPSGHTIRSWLTALLLVEINPEAAESVYRRAWDYGESRVIAGAHWQSDVDASRVAASIGYSSLQTCPAFRAQMSLAKEEFKKLKH